MVYTPNFCQVNINSFVSHLKTDCKHDLMNNLIGQGVAKRTQL